VERKYTAAIFEGKFYYFTVLDFGSAIATTVWGRFAAFAARSTTAVCPRCLEIYVDDSILLASGPLERASRVISLAIRHGCVPDPGPRPALLECHLGVH
jgi:hypothetical protein